MIVQVLDAMIRTPPAGGVSVAGGAGASDPHGAAPGILTRDAFFAHWHQAQVVE